MRRSGGCLPVLGVLALVVAVTIGGWVVGAATRHPPVEVGTITVEPALGWVPAGRYREDGFHGLRLTTGSANLEILVPADRASLLHPLGAEVTHDAREAARALIGRYVSISLERDLRDLRTSRVRDVTVRGGPGLRMGYSGISREDGAEISGELTATSAGALFDGWAPDGGLRAVADEIHEMVDGP